MKVFVSKEIPESGIQLMINNGLEVTVCKEKIISQDDLIKNCLDKDALLSLNADKIDKEFLNKCSHLKVIAQCAVGFDNIDISEATRLGIPVSNTPEVLSAATADVAFILLLNASRKAFYMHKKIIAGEWKYFSPTENLGIELRNKTLGIFGLGRIGFEMAKLCKNAYNMDIIYYNRSNNHEAEKQLGAKKVEFEELLKLSDVISVHSALTDETRGKFNLDVFKKMKKNSIFINTARGAIHNEDDLIQALNDEIIWGAGLDVTNPEPMHADNPLLNMPNVAILPHIGSATIETRDKMSILAAENIIAGLKGERPPTIINPDVYLKKV